MDTNEMLERVRRRFPQLPPQLAEDIADFAMAQVEERENRIIELEAQLLALHITLFGLDTESR